jgi:hypothetical protein
MTLLRLYQPSRNVVSVFRWLGLALLGILVAAGVSIAASRLASQQIGLASQPVSAGDALAPASERHTGGTGHPHANPNVHHRHRGETRQPPESAPRPEEATPPASPAPETEPTPPSQPPTGGEDGEHGGGGGADD